MFKAIRIKNIHHKYFSYDFENYSFFQTLVFLLRNLRILKSFYFSYFQDACAQVFRAIKNRYRKKSFLLSLLGRLLKIFMKIHIQII